MRLARPLTKKMPGCSSCSAIRPPWRWSRPASSSRQRAGRLVLAEGHGLPVAELDQSIEPGKGITGQVWLQGKAVVVDDYRQWKHATPRGKAAGLSAVAGVPLAVGGRPLGVLAIVAAD